MAKAASPTIGIAALVMFGIVYFIGCLQKGSINRIWENDRAFFIVSKVVDS